jgi:ferredoxin
MKVIKIDKKDWAQGIVGIQSAYRLFGPVRNDKSHDYKELGKGELPDLNYSNTRLSPKFIIYPQSEIMFKYSLDEKDPDHHIMKDAPKDYSPKAVLGIRPCDAAAFLIVKRNFDTPEYKDPYWIRAYESTTLVGAACNNPCGTCFCTTAGSGPFNEDGLDVILVEEEDFFFAKAVTEKGEKLLDAAGWKTAADAGAVKKMESMKKEAEGKMSSFVSTGDLKKKKTTELYDAPFWEDVSFSCINCGTCTYLCPTCWCFDIQDENSGSSGCRMKNWDSCMFPLFTIHGTGHNPRGTKLHRVRQRFMHKLKYFVDKYDNGIQCVGCGRCIRSCPVNIDIRRVCDIMNGYAAEACACSVK